MTESRTITSENLSAWPDALGGEEVEEVEGGREGGREGGLSSPEYGLGCEHGAVHFQHTLLHYKVLSP